MKLRLISALLGLAIMSGLCTSCLPFQPGIFRAREELPAAFHEERHGATPLIDDAEQRWWERYGDTQLNRLVEMAFAENFDLAKAQARYKQALSTKKSLVSERFPTVTLGANASRDHQPGVSRDHTGTNARFSLAASYEADLWGAVAHRVEGADFDAAALGEDLKFIYLSLSAEIVDLYFLGIEQQLQISLNQKIIASYTNNLERIRERYSEGLIGPLDVYQAEQNLMTAKARQAGFRSTLAVAEHNLAFLTGQMPGEYSLPQYADFPAISEDAIKTAPSDLLTRRPDVRAALQRLRASDARLAVAVARQFPSVNLAASFGRARMDTAAGVATGTFWNMLVDLVQPIFDAGRRRAEVERNEAIVEEGVEHFKQVALRAAKEVEDAVVRYELTRRRLSILSKRVVSADAALQLARDQYFEGIADYLPVVVAEILHDEAQRELISARRQLHADRISLMRSIGGNWLDSLVQENPLENP